MVLSLEVWKTIPNLEMYEASSFGNIRSKLNFYTSTYKGTPIVRKKKTNLIGKKLNKKGYQRVHINGVVYQVHRLIAITFILNDNNYNQINHKNGIKTDNRVDNLEWCTNSQNRQHAVLNNLHAYGSKLSKKLNYSQVVEIRKLYEIDKISQKEISKRYNLSQQTVSKICTYKTWRIKE